MATNGNDTNDEALWKGRCELAFSKYDGDDDGRLEPNELLAYLEGVGQPTTADQLLRTLAKFRLHKNSRFTTAESFQVGPPVERGGERVAGSGSRLTMFPLDVPGLLACLLPY